MNKPCYSAIKEHSPTKPVIIFVASRRQTRLTALDLINYAAGDDNPDAFLGCGSEYAEGVSKTLRDSSLQHTITFGIGLVVLLLDSDPVRQVVRIREGGRQPYDPRHSVPLITAVMGALAGGTVLRLNDLRYEPGSAYDGLEDGTALFPQ